MLKEKTMFIAAILYALAVGLVVYSVMNHAIVAGLFALAAAFLALYLARVPSRS